MYLLPFQGVPLLLKHKLFELAKFELMNDWFPVGRLFPVNSAREGPRLCAAKLQNLIDNCVQTCTECMPLGVKCFHICSVILLEVLCFHITCAPICLLVTKGFFFPCVAGRPSFCGCAWWSRSVGRTFLQMLSFPCSEVHGKLVAERLGQGLTYQNAIKKRLLIKKSGENHVFCLSYEKQSLLLQKLSQLHADS